MISVLIPAYGRVQLLEESVRCFLSQTVTDTELIILNDYAGHRLFYDDPRITVINADRYSTVGDKRNALMAMAKGDWLTFWDDDDLYLPGHLQALLDLTKAFTGNVTGRQYRNWIDSGGTLYRYDFSPLMHTLLIDTPTIRGLGPFPSINIDEDMAMMSLILSAGLLVGPSSQDADMPTCIVRRSTGCYHLSDYADSAALGAVDAQEHSSNQPKGDYWLKPQWHADYLAKAQASWSAVLAVRT